MRISCFMVSIFKDMDMDSIAQLALMSKAKKVFEKEGTFLSFPVTPLAYKKEDFEFFSQVSASDLLQSKKNLNAFSILVNLIPSGESWLPTETKFLWDVYKDILSQGICASSTRTAEEEMALQKAKAYLKIPGEGGILQDSPQVTVYNQYKDVYCMLEQEYMEARSSGEAAADEEEKKQWRDIDEPAFRNKLLELEKKWILDGYKNEVEIARSQYISLSAKSPILTWSEWVENFNPDIDSQVSADDLSLVFPSCFAPSNALEESSWKSFSLDEVEVKALINETSVDLRNLFSIDTNVSSIKSISLEFSSATVKRSWFESEIFRSRFWRFSDDTKVISDGDTPPSGDCPAYVTAIVFARKIAIEQNQTNQTNQTNQLPLLPSGSVMFNNDLSFNLIAKDQTKIPSLAIKRQSASIWATITNDPKNNVLIQPIKKETNKTADLIYPISMLKVKDDSKNNVLIQPIKGEINKTANLTIKANKATNLIYPASMLKLKAMTFTRPLIEFEKRPAVAVKLQEKIETSQDENIYVLAFICKALPRCPDPDLTLQW